MTTPSLYRFLPDAYTRREESDLYKLLNGLSGELTVLKGHVSDFRGDLTLSTGDGEGLDRAGENYNVGRPPGMEDTYYSAVVRAMAGMRRGTVAAIKQVLETATGQSWTVQDKQLNSSIPATEVWCSIAGSGLHYSYGRGVYADIDANYDKDPLESSIAGTVLDEEGETGAYYNDHAWSHTDRWVRELVERVKAAGMKIVYI